MSIYRKRDNAIAISAILVIVGAFLVVSGIVMAMAGSGSPNPDVSPSPVSETSRNTESDNSVIGEESRSDDTSRADGLIERYLSLADRLDSKSRTLANEDFVIYMIDNHGEDTVCEICDALEGGYYTPQLWYDLTGCTITVHDDIFNLRLDPTCDMYDPYICYKGTSKTEGIIKLGFGGDFSFADNYYVGKAYVSRGENLDSIIDPALVALMKEHDVMTVNCEFALTDETSALKGKRFVFRASPEKAWIFDALGIELVTVGNNHVFDYGEKGFTDTLDTLRNAGVKYIGAGRDADEASQAWYFIINGRKIGILNGYRANEGAVVFTPGATETSGGVLYAFDSEKMSALVEKTKSQCDVLILFMHWGREDVTALETVIKKQGKQYIDAGADVIVGCHTHVAQGIEIYDGKPIFYSMGNFLFNFKELDSCLVSVEIDDIGHISSYYTPLLQKRTKIWLADSEVAQRIRDKIMSVSINTVISAYNLVSAES